LTNASALSATSRQPLSIVSAWPLATARELLTTAMPVIERRGLTLVGVALANLEDDGAVQLALPFDGQRAGDLDAVLDKVRDRFGSTAITRAVLLGRDHGLSVPLLPD
jgi:DNA polymerase-4